MSWLKQLECISSNPWILTQNVPQGSVAKMNTGNKKELGQNVISYLRQHCQDLKANWNNPVQHAALSRLREVCSLIDENKSCFDLSKFFGRLSVQETVSEQFEAVLRSCQPELYLVPGLMPVTVSLPHSGQKVPGLCPVLVLCEKIDQMQLSEPKHYSAVIESCRSLKVIPSEIKALLDLPYNMKNFERIEKWKRSRDEIVVWNALAPECTMRSIDVTVFSDEQKTNNAHFQLSALYEQNKDRLSSIQSLKLNSLNLSTLPEQLGLCSQLTYLNLGHNQLYDLPDSLGNLTNLGKIFLDNNKFMHVPVSVSKLTKLIYFDISRNQVSELPETLANLSELEQLILHHNALERIPISLTTLAKLVIFDISFNQIKELPYDVSDLQSLEEAKLHHNPLTHLPNSELSKLRLIDVSFTHVKKVLPNHQ